MDPVPPEDFDYVSCEEEYRLRLQFTGCATIWWRWRNLNYNPYHWIPVPFDDSPSSFFQVVVYNEHGDCDFQTFSRLGEAICVARLSD